MTKNKKYKNKVEENNLREPSASYSVKKSVIIFKSFEEQDEYNRIQMANLTPYERLLQLRKMINLAYGMHGYDPDNLPTKHKLTIL
jgi:hypothetical protein